MPDQHRGVRPVGHRLALRHSVRGNPQSVRALHTDDARRHAVEDRPMKPTPLQLPRRDLLGCDPEPLGTERYDAARDPAGQAFQNAPASGSVASTPGDTEDHADARRNRRRRSSRSRGGDRAARPGGRSGGHHHARAGGRLRLQAALGRRALRARRRPAPAAEEVRARSERRARQRRARVGVARLARAAHDRAATS